MWPSQSHKNLFDTATSRSLLGMWCEEPGFARKKTRWNFREKTLIINHDQINYHCTRWRCLLQHVSSTQWWSFIDFWFLNNNVFEAKKQQQNKTVRQLLLVRNIYWLWYCTLHCKTLNYISSLTKRHLCTNLKYILDGRWKKLILAILGSHVVWSQEIRCGGIGVGGNAPLVCDPFVSIVACSKLKSQRPAILASRNLGKMVGRGCADPIPGISARSCFICTIQFWWQVMFGQVLAKFWQKNTFPCDLTCKWWFN